ncbi:SDR family NAD(P)-dependent oxidoreductase [Kiloniella laminariae]|uniref:SDR family NAD(P)-dependent oxidoreductase n=1 Tax=Kiloniella laminariae TaxID=454162 RepID=A0ABT4LN28_9PROT|nr:SDR family NAD(P)-dependent oxidoreductase [Kiloniella laminariae]MCZ4282514.1 SDR family NAD(P)-dependent oxidoreductase [Kiloniella laminariae]
MKLSGLTALITGGGSGLGEAVARHLADKGVKCGLIDLNDEGVNRVATDIDGLAVTADVTDPDAIRSAVSMIEKMLGPIRIVVNCAGIAPGAKLVGREGAHDLDLFRKTIEINLIGAFNVMRLAAERMVSYDEVDGERGVIINTASIAAWEGQIGQAAYAASKGGVASLTLPLSRELARSAIRVVAIAPGVMETPMVAGMSDKVKEALIEKSLFPKRLGQPEEFAALAAHICENAFLNGTTIRLDGSVRLA